MLSFDVSVCGTLWFPSVRLDVFVNLSDWILFHGAFLISNLYSLLFIAMKDGAFCHRLLTERAVLDINHIVKYLQRDSLPKIESPPIFASPLCRCRIWWPLLIHRTLLEFQKERTIHPRYNGSLQWEVAVAQEAEWVVHQSDNRQFNSQLLGEDT